MLKQLLSSIYSWIAIVIVVIAVMTTNSFYVLNTLNDLSSLEAKLFTTNRVISVINRLHVAVLRVESGQRGYMLTDNQKYLSDYTETLNTLNTLINDVEVSAYSSGIDEQQQRIDSLLFLARQKVNKVIEAVELLKMDRRDEAFAILNSDEGFTLYSQFDALFTKIDESERELQGTHLANLMALRRDAVNTLIISSVTTLLLISTIFLLLKINARGHEKYQADLEAINQNLESRIAARTQELSIYSDELARSNRELEDFAFVASHDLQEPLRKIRAFGNRLESGYADVIDERGRDFLARMLNAAERMSMLITDLLAFSRVSTRGKDFIDVDLNVTLDSVINDLEIAIDEKKATVTYSLMPTIRGDRSQLEQLFLNLLSNALKFQPQARAPLVNIAVGKPQEHELEGLTMSDKYDWVKIDVTDNGIGFEQSFAEKIFAPFQRLHGRTVYKGTGIGLAVCRRIVERHNGQISATSVLGKGATFSILIPTNSVPFGVADEPGEQCDDA